jgi:hypothetical protein
MAATARQEIEAMPDDWFPQHRHRFPRCRRRVFGLCLLFVWAFNPAGADETNRIDVKLNHHRFEPAEIHVPVGKPVILFVTNEDDTAEEFDSSALKIEKVIAAGHYAAIRLRPLGRGRYPFMGEFHADTAQGVVVSE